MLKTDKLFSLESSTNKHQTEKQRSEQELPGHIWSITMTRSKEEMDAGLLFHSFSSSGLAQQEIELLLIQSS